MCTLRECCAAGGIPTLGDDGKVFCDGGTLTTDRCIIEMLIPPKVPFDVAAVQAQIIKEMAGILKEFSHERRK